MGVVRRLGSSAWRRSIGRLYTPRAGAVLLASPGANGGAARQLRQGRWYAAITAAIVIAAVIAAIGPYPVGVFYDDGIYLVLAKALATGEGYRYLNIPGTPAATHYPPGYPIVLAALWKVTPEFPRNWWSS